MGNLDKINISHSKAFQQIAIPHLPIIFSVEMGHNARTM